VLLLTGPVGVGKSTVAAAAAWLLREANVPHAAVDLARLAECWPVPADDPWHEQLLHRNLACVWANFQQAGAERLLLTRVLEARSLLRHVVAAVPGAQITVVRLRAPPPIPPRHWNTPGSRTTWLTTPTARSARSPPRSSAAPPGCHRRRRSRWTGLALGRRMR